MFINNQVTYGHIAIYRQRRSRLPLRPVPGARAAPRLLRPQLRRRAARLPAHRLLGTSVLTQTVHILAARLNITDMPLTDVVEEAVRAYNLSPQQVGEFARKIKKTKNIMKRRRAKNRQPCEENSFAFEKKTLVF